MTYEIGKLPLETLLPAIARAEDRLARLDELVRRSPVGEGFIQRSHFFDSAASMWVVGELVHVEDLVLHDAHMDIRTPTHELTIAHSILRARRRIATALPDWALSEQGVVALTGTQLSDESAEDSSDVERAVELHTDHTEEREALAAEFAHIDAVLERSERLIGTVLKGGANVIPERRGVSISDLIIRDPDWGEGDRPSLKSAIGHLY